METKSETALPAFHRAWQALRFATADMPGPVAYQYVQRLRDLEYVVSHVMEEDPMSEREGLAAFYDSFVDPRAQKIVAECVSARASLG